MTEEPMVVVVEVDNHDDSRVIRHICLYDTGLRPHTNDRGKNHLLPSCLPSTAFHLDYLLLI